MREQLIQYVNLLFAGAKDSEEIKQEILQNTLDRYDDLVLQGKSPEAAYQLAISGIGDISEILGTQPSFAPTTQVVKEVIHDEVEDIRRKKMRAVAIAMYILCALPLIILGDMGLDNLGLCLTLALVAAATYLMLITKKSSDDDEEDETEQRHEHSPRKELKKSIDNLVWAIGLAVYLILSFLTGAWYITWIIFPLIGCVQGLVNAIIDLKEANQHEK